MSAKQRVKRRRKPSRYGTPNTSTISGVRKPPSATGTRTATRTLQVTHQELVTIPVRQPIPVVDFSADGRMLAVSDLPAVGRGIRILLAPTFEEIAERKQNRPYQPVRQ